MSDKAREQRRVKKLEKDRKKRANVGRPAKEPRQQVATAPNPRDGFGWPVGPCYLTETWYEQGARIHAVFSRSTEDGRTVAAFFDVDLASDGVVSAKVIGLPSPEYLPNEIAQLSESSGKSLVEVAPGRVSLVVREAQRLATANNKPACDGLADAVDLVGDFAVNDEIPVLVGPPPPPPPPKGDSLFGWIGRKLLGS